MSHLQRFSILTASATLILILAGALVTSTGSGLSVPDWPLSFGQFFPEMKGAVFFEHGHRMVAGTVAILTAALALWLWLVEKRRWLVRLGTIALIAVILQAVLGGLTVLYQLPPGISIAHAVLAQTFFCLVVTIAFYVNQNESKNLQSPHVGAIHESPLQFKISIVTTLLIFAQVILGAALRHIGYSFLISHILLAVLVTISIAFVTVIVFKKHRSENQIVNLGLALMVILILQVTLGLASAYPGMFPFITGWAGPVALVTVHVVLGALLLTSSLLMTLKLGLVLEPQHHIESPSPRLDIVYES